MYIDIDIFMYKQMYIYLFISIHSTYIPRKHHPSFQLFNFSTFPPHPPYVFHFFDQNPIVKHFGTSVFTGKNLAVVRHSNYQWHYFSEANGEFSGEKIQKGQKESLIKQKQKHVFLPAAALHGKQRPVKPKK